MIFNDGSQYRVLTNMAAYQAAGRDLYCFRAASAKNGVPYIDAAFSHHRQISAGLRGVCMYQFVYQNAGSPEAQAVFFLNALGGGLATNEMVMLDMESAGGVANPADFFRRWTSVVEGALDTRVWVYVPSALSGSLSRGLTQERVVMAPRYSGNALMGTPPSWSWDIHQYTEVGAFPGCTQAGDLSFTNLTTEAMLMTCNPHGTASPCGV